MTMFINSPSSSCIPWFQFPQKFPHLTHTLGFGRTATSRILHSLDPSHHNTPLDMCLPCLVIGLPLHPMLEHLSCTRNVLQELFKVDILVP